MKAAYFKIKPSSPIFIGDRQGSDLNKWRYARNGENIYVIDELRLAKKLVSSSKVEEFEEAIKNDEREGLRWFLSKYNMLPEIENLSKYKYSISNSNFPRSSAIKTFIKDNFLVPYIPGTSIKGSIRTAILFDFLSYIKEKDENQFNSLIKSCLNIRDKKKVDDNLISETFSILSRAGEESTEESYWDILKAVKISDAYPNGKDLCKIISGYNIKVFGSHEINISIEALKKDTEFNFSISIDDFILDEFYKKFKALQNHNHNKYTIEYLKNVKDKFKIDEMLKICTNFSRKIIEKEKEYAESNNYNDVVTFYKSIESRENIIRLGYGSGLLSITIDTLMNDDQIENVRKRYFKGRTERNNFPKTRRYIVNKDNVPISPLGWCRIEEVGNGRNN